MTKAFPIARTFEEAAEQERVRNAELYSDWERQRGQIAALTARVAELEKDAARYRWLRDRINWRDDEVVTGKLVQKVRFWTHWDWRPYEKRPASEHIDDYIDAALSAADSGCQSKETT